MRSEFRALLEKFKDDVFIGKWCQARLVIGGRVCSEVLVDSERSNPTSSILNQELDEILSKNDHYVPTIVLLLHHVEKSKVLPDSIIFRMVSRRKNSNTVTQGSTPFAVLVGKGAKSALMAKLEDVPLMMRSVDPFIKEIVSLRLENGV